MAYPVKGRADYLELGDWNAVCFECGRKFKASELKRNWQGYWVCPKHWEARHPQDFVRGVPDVQTPPWVQPMPADTFATFCTPNGITAICDYAKANCAIADKVHPAFDPTIDYYIYAPLVISAPTTVGTNIVVWAGQYLEVLSDLTVNGTLGVH